MQGAYPRRDQKQQHKSTSDGWLRPQTADQEEETTPIHQRQRSWKKQHQDVEVSFSVKSQNKWVETVDLQGFLPDEVKVKVNSTFHTLEITAQRLSNPWQSTQQSCNKLKRVIPLPENLNLEKLKVHMNTADGELLLKAPFLKREDGITKEQEKHKCHKPSDSSSANIPVMWKDTSSSIPLQPQTQSQSESLTPFDLSNCTVQEYLRLLKKSSSLTPGKMLATEVVKDEGTGKWKIIIDINAVGFTKEEVKVTFQEAERNLVVEAKHDKAQPTSKEQGICVKQLRQEIVVPQWLDGKQMRFRLMENGVLRIQMPCLRNPCPKNKEEEQKQ